VAVPIFVLDAWPVLEWLKAKQPAAVRFRTLLNQASAGEVDLVMCRLNFGEVVYRIRKDFPEVDQAWVRGVVDKLPINLHSVTDSLVDDAASLKGSFAISYADAFAAALASQLNQPLVTGDKDFLLLEISGVVKLHWLGA
jgi:uncharacterized protein